MEISFPIQEGKPRGMKKVWELIKKICRGGSYRALSFEADFVNRVDKRKTLSKDLNGAMNMD